jgi:hypothetical protein
MIVTAATPVAFQLPHQGFVRHIVQGQPQAIQVTEFLNLLPREERHLCYNSHTSESFLQ